MGRRGQLLRGTGVLRSEICASFRPMQLRLAGFAGFPPSTSCSFEPNEWHGQPDFLVNRNYLPFIFGERPAFRLVLDFPCLALY